MLAEGRWPGMVAAVVLMVFAAWVIYLRPRDPLHRALALLVGVRGFGGVLLALGPSFADVTGRVAVYALLAVPFCAVSLAALVLARESGWGGPLGRGPRLVRALALVGALTVEGAFLLRHDWWLSDGAGGWLSLAIPMLSVSFAAVGLVFALAYRAQGRRLHGRGLFLASLGFVAEPTYRSFGAILQGPWPSGSVSPGSVSFGLFAVALALCLVSVAVLLGAGRPGRARRRLDARFVAMFVGLAALSAIFVSLQSVRVAQGSPISVYIKPLLFFDAAWMLVMAALVTYAILLYELFGIEIKARLVVHGGLIGGLMTAVFVVGVEFLESFVTAGRGAVASIGLAVVLAALFWPIHRLAMVTAAGLFPGVARTSAYHARRSDELFRAALTQALREGPFSAGDRRTLSVLRGQLGLSDAQAQQIEAEVRGGFEPRAPEPGDGPGPRPPEGALDG